MSWRRLKAFTLMEVMVAMALSGIAAGLAVWVFVQVGRMADATAKANAHASEVALLQYGLGRDIRAADSVQLADDKLLILGADSIEWLRASSYLLRENRDTFEVETTEWKLETQGPHQHLKIKIGENPSSPPLTFKVSYESTQGNK